MMKDILFDTDGELQFENGDFLVGESDTQNVKLIVEANKGEFKQHPQLGFGAINYVKSNVSAIEFKRDLKIQLKMDGYRPKIDISEGFENLKIEI